MGQKVIWEYGHTHMGQYTHSGQNRYIIKMMMHELKMKLL